MTGPNGPTGMSFDVANIIADMGGYTITWLVKEVDSRSSYSSQIFNLLDSNVSLTGRDNSRSVLLL
ncbi:unnamed protein product [Protopolystoma xenopodis]|uniref:Uncharacterized protein n=1 Tax=Protopolystoma xenopodis TaxID=117903 RepID=A0A3S5ARP9_9PLAT|nr:unnamed protein product [Protopolystoma xenopodis]